MNPATLIALKASIEHWKRLESGEDTTVGIGACALCARFYNNGEERCEKEGEHCPVRKSSGYRWCEGTPYEKASDLSNDTDSPEFKSAAKLEREFLESLLPTTPEEPSTTP